IRTGSYEKNGQKVYTTDVVVDHFDLLDSRNSNESSNVTQQKQNDPFSNNRQPVDITDELPF
ncbi:MAG: single-stranded DNA-binding protein, partial [Liquorilactobacillus satsumensis]